jgi:alkylation response protein AidB-like acyl-CoA dehydrogenase
VDLTFPPEAEAFRSRIRAFLRDNLPPDWPGIGALDDEERLEFGRRWREIVAREGLLAVAWPREYGGGGMGPLEQFVLAEEFVTAGVPLRPLPGDQHGLSLIGPTILQSGTEEQRRFFLPRILSGEHRWAQGYSEPDAGSDLASLRTRAQLVGDQWVVNGQKTWQTTGDAANWIFVLARTAPDAPRHAGLSLLLLPIDQPGVEVRPIRTLTGHAEFCEFFFTDARADADHVVGGVHNGWTTAMTLLGFERGASVAATAAAARVELDRLATLIRRHGKDGDALVRQRFAWCLCRVQILRLLALRTLTRLLADGRTGPESSILKLYVSQYQQRVTELAMDVLGLDGTVQSGRGAVAHLGPDPLGGSDDPAAWETVFLTTRAATIYGGSSQIQRNVLGERVLGLPREPAAPRGAPR